MVEAEPFFVPLGDEVLIHGPASLEFTNEICVGAGGPSQLVWGHAWLTHDWLAFRPKLGMPHPQQVTLNRDAITDATVVQPKLLGLFKLRRPRLEVRYRYSWIVGDPVPHLFELDSPDRWTEVLNGARRSQKRSARQLVQDALDDGERERGRYTGALEQLSFPRSHWYTEDPTERDEALMAGLEGLGIDVPANFLTTLDLAVRVETGPEDYEIGPGTEEWGRREQIRRVCEAINAGRGGGERRFCEYAEDLPGWPECFEPLWLWLSQEEDERLRELGIVAAKAADENS